VNQLVLTEDMSMIEHNDEIVANETEERKSGLITTLITLLVILAMLSMLVAPLLRSGPHRLPTPTPKPEVLQEA
jgi:hypothetical protein